MSTSSPSTDPPRPVTSEAASVQIRESHDVICLGGVEWLVARSVAEDADAFIAAIEASLREPSHAAERCRRAVVSCTWERRTAEKSELIRRRLAGLCHRGESAAATQPIEVVP